MMELIADKEPKIAVSGDTGGMESGQLCVKLRLPKALDERDDGGCGSETVITKDWLRECALCRKRFRSRKALGGHMRIHMQEQRENMKKQFRAMAELQSFRAGVVSPTSLDDKNAPTCVVCCRTFPSLKSLYGHMRSHPDREWRGVQPPVAGKKSKSGIDTPMAGWSVTGKRGRRSIGSVTSGSSLGSEKAGSSTHEKGEEEKAVICCFMMLSNGESLSKPSRSDEKISVTKEAEETGKSVGVAVNAEFTPEKRPDDLDVKAEIVRNNNSCSGLNDKKSKRAIKRKARELDEINCDHRAKRAAEDVSDRLSASKHTCNKCNKSFSSHQALGGHKSSCNKSKQSTSHAIEENGPQSGSLPPPPPKLSDSTDHSSGCNSVKTKCGHRLFNFDLNELPTSEEFKDKEKNYNNDLLSNYSLNSLAPTMIEFL